MTQFRLFNSLLCCLILVVVVPPILSQRETIESDKPLIARTLSGHVYLKDSTIALKGILVEECSDGWKDRKSFTTTDEKGYFTLPDATKAGIHFLRLSNEGMHTLLIKVKIGHSGPRDLTLTLSNAT